MSELTEIVSLAITTNTSTVTREGFGTALIVAYHNFWADTHREYTSLSGLTADLVPNYHPIYKKAAAAFGQNPRPEKVIVAKLGAAPAYTWTITVTSATEGDVISLYIVDTLSGAETQVSYTVLAAETTTTVATALELLVEAVTGITSSSAGAVVTATPASAGDRFYLHTPVNCEVVETTVDADYDDYLSTFQLVNDDWYFILIDSDSQANVNKVAAWALAEGSKLFVTSTCATNELTGAGTLGSTLSAASNNRTVLLWAPDSSEEAGAALCGVVAARDPGAYTAAFRVLNGITGKALTDTQRGYLIADNINRLAVTNGRTFVMPGVVATGEFIDIIHGTDALKARLKEDLLALFLGTEKVPFTDLGGDLIRNTILGTLRSFEGRGSQPGLLAEGSSEVVVPAVADVLEANKNARFWDEIQFSATYEGAVHKVGLEGTLSV